MPRPCDPAALLLAKRQACRVNDAMKANHCCRAKLNWNYMTSVSEDFVILFIADADSDFADTVPGGCRADAG